RAGLFWRGFFQSPPERDGLFQILARLRLVAEGGMNLADAGKLSGQPRPVVERPGYRHALLVKIERRFQFAERLMNEAQVAKYYRFTPPVSGEAAQVEGLRICLNRLPQISRIDVEPRQAAERSGFAAFVAGQTPPRPSLPPNFQRLLPLPDPP